MAATGPATPATPVVRHVAEQWGVNLQTVTGTGVGGRITLGDVRAKARAMRAGTGRPSIAPVARLGEPGASVSVAYGADGRPVRNPFVVAKNAGVNGADVQARELADVHGILLENIRGTGPNAQVTVADVQATVRQETAARALSAPREPAAASTLAEQPLPAFTASGIDPKVLLDVPAPVRPAMAAASTRADAFALAERYSGMSDEAAEAALAGDGSVDFRYGGYRGAWGR